MIERRLGLLVALERQTEGLAGAWVDVGHLDVHVDGPHVVAQRDEVVAGGAPQVVDLGGLLGGLAAPAPRPAEGEEAAAGRDEPEHHEASVTPAATVPASVAAASAGEAAPLGRDTVDEPGEDGVEPLAAVLADRFTGQPRARPRGQVRAARAEVVAGHDRIRARLAEGVVQQRGQAVGVVAGRLLAGALGQHRRVDRSRVRGLDVLLQPALLPRAQARIGLRVDVHGVGAQGARGLVDLRPGPRRRGAEGKGQQG